MSQRLHPTYTHTSLLTQPPGSTSGGDGLETDVKGSPEICGLAPSGGFLACRTISSKAHSAGSWIWGLRLRWGKAFPPSSEKDVIEPFLAAQ